MRTRDTNRIQHVPLTRNDNTAYLNYMQKFSAGPIKWLLFLSVSYWRLFTYTSELIELWVSIHFETATTNT